MGVSLIKLSTELVKKKIRPSYQRMKVYEYLINNPCHPSVDQIYKDLHPEIPTLSKTTIYNALGLFVDTGLVRVLTIEENETRYDIFIENHGHFKCEACALIYDFSIDTDSLSTDGLAGFKIKDKNVYFKGTCLKCLEDINKRSERSN